MRGRLPRLASGWFALAFSSELRPGAVLRRRLGGDDVVLARDGGGAAIGLGRAVCERHGVVLAWAGAAAPWPIRDDDDAVWSAPAARQWRIHTHPQEIIENTVDVAHFATVHRYGGVEITAPMRADGPYLTMGYAARRGRLRLDLDIAASGVGYSRVHVRVLGLRLRTVVMPTPVDEDVTEVRVITQLARPLRGAWLAAAAMGRDFAADIPIWERKRYQDPPQLCADDGPIGPYRRWASQFMEASR